MEATLKSKKGKKAGAPKKRSSPQGKAPSQAQAQAQSFQEDEVMADESRYVGCFASESSFLGPSLHPHLPSFLLFCFTSFHSSLHPHLPSLLLLLSFLERFDSLPPSVPPSLTSLTRTSYQKQDHSYFSISSSFSHSDILSLSLSPSLSPQIAFMTEDQRAQTMD